MPRVALIFVCVAFIALWAQPLSATPVPPQTGLEKEISRDILMPPNDLTIQIIGGMIILSWSAIPFADTYIIEFTPDMYADYMDVTAAGFLNATSTTCTWIVAEDQIVAPGAAVYFRVRSVDIPTANDSIMCRGGMFSTGYSELRLSSFFIDRFEVTQSSYYTVMTTNPSYNTGNPYYPVEQVTWYNAIEYCNRRSAMENLQPCYIYNDGTNYGTDVSTWPAGWYTAPWFHQNIYWDIYANGYRLPSEAEWEFAARGGNLTQNYEFSGGNTLNDVAWNAANSSGTTHTVGTRAPNELGIFDMSGNVGELVWDIFDNYPSYKRSDPRGPVVGDHRCSRGGNFFESAMMCRVWQRDWDFASNGCYQYYGFRVCKGMPPEESSMAQAGTYTHDNRYPVTISNNLYFDKFEITQASYQSVMGYNPSFFPGVFFGPVEKVSWYNAIEYCNLRSERDGFTPCYSYFDGTTNYGTNTLIWPANWDNPAVHVDYIICDWYANGYRLPTWAEWEWAALGGIYTHYYTYSGSNDRNEVAWWADNSNGTTHQIATLAPNELGLYDMSGNIGEWTWDAFYFNYPNAPLTDPHEDSGGSRVVKGGFWAADSSISWDIFSPVMDGKLTFNPVFGFRVCRRD